MKKMNPTVKTMWIDALTSGKYKQGQGRLQDRESEAGVVRYCVIGVLCDLHRKKVSHKKFNGTYLGRSAIAPKTVRNWAGLDMDTAGILMGRNDTGCWSFKRLAAYIKRYL